MGRVAGASRAVDGNGVEYKLDPEAVAEMGLRKGDAVVVRAVPGRFATFRKTVARKNPSPTLTVWSVSGSATDRQLGRMFPTGWTRLSDGHIATLASYANKVRGVSANVVGTMPLAEVMRKQIKNPAHLAHPGKFRQGQVVRLRGSRKRYVIATDVDPDVFGYHLVALSGGEVGSAPSGVRANDLELDADQTVSFSGAQAHKLARKYENTARVHQEHQRWLASEYPVSRRANPLVRASKPKRPLSREQKAVKLVEDALKANIVIHWVGPKNEGTAGRYLTALGPSKFAVIAYGRAPWDFYGTAGEVAGSLVRNIGVGNVIDALKATARMHDTAYTNLDTPISWATPRRR